MAWWALHWCACIPPNSTRMNSFSASYQAAHWACRRWEPKTPLPPTLALVLAPMLTLLALRPSALLQPSVLAACYALFVATLATSVVSYRLSPVHPLAEFPGPRINKVSKLWSVYITTTGHQHIHNKRLHDLYGPIVRTGRHALRHERVEAYATVRSQRTLDSRFGRRHDRAGHKRPPEREMYVRCTYTRALDTYVIAEQIMTRDKTRMRHGT